MLKNFNTCYRSVLAIFATFFIHVRAVLVTLIATSAMFIAQSAAANNYVRYVDDSASAGGDGIGWSTAYRILQDALAEAAVLTSGATNTHTVEISVAAGTYYPDRFNDSTTGTGSQAATFSLLERVSMYGGYSGSGSTRDPLTYNSYLDGDIDQDNTLDDDNSYHVVSATDSAISASNCQLDGFTIRHGNADGSSSDGTGGGIFLYYAHPKIRGCTISDNTANRGGGIMCLNTETGPEIRNCRILANSVTGSHQPRGGGLDGNYSVTVINTLFQGNTADEWGGGLSIEGGVVGDQAEVVIENCQFVGNECFRYGAGVYIDTLGGLDLSLTNCLFNSNHGTSTNPNEGSDGGGMWTANFTTATVTNCTFVHNSVGTGQGGGWADYSSVSSTGTVTNCIFYDNTAPGVHDFVQSTGVLSVTYCAMKQGLYSGTGNIDLSSQDPGFVDNGSNPIDNDYRLDCDSYCLDKGISSAVAADAQNVDEDGSTTEKAPDLDLKFRNVSADLDTSESPHLPKVDLGAYEKQVTSPCSTAQYADCAPLVCTDGQVNIDDLVMVITRWGSCPSAEAFCPGDVVINYLNAVDIDDLVAVITHWSESCVSEEYDAGSLTSVQDCIDAATEEYTPYTQDWEECIEKCVDALCEAEIIDCD